jgi:hypothetical protein
MKANLDLISGPIRGTQACKMKCVNTLGLLGESSLAMLPGFPQIRAVFHRPLDLGPKPLQTARFAKAIHFL